MNVFVLGNGESRRGISLDSLRPHGSIFGCNALYRDFTPDLLVSVDTKMIQEIKAAAYPGLTLFREGENLIFSDGRSMRSPGWSAGPTALLAACSSSPRGVCYLLGFDFCSSDSQINNIYKGTLNYKPASASPTFSGNFIDQTVQVVRGFPDWNFLRVQGSAVPLPNPLRFFANIRDISIDEMWKSLNCP